MNNENKNIKISCNSFTNNSRDTRDTKRAKNYVELPVTGGYKTKVDPETPEKLEGKRLHLRDKKNKYISFYDRKIKKNISLHRFIMNPECNLIVDHINGDTLDNRKCNLRCCNTSINTMNHQKPPRSNSGFWGVYQRSSLMFQARVNKDFKNITCGHYKSKFIASIMRDYCVIKYFKIKVGLNFPEEIHQNNLRNFIDNTKGRIFKICFVKRTDGSFREMLCRTGVTINVNGSGQNEPIE